MVANIHTLLSRRKNFNMWKLSLLLSVVLTTNVFAQGSGTPVSINSQRDAEGWTVLRPSEDSRLIYVSNVGLDTNSGLSPETPKKTIKAAIKLLRRGFPDWIQLERGSVFEEGRISFGTSGRSDTEKMVVTSYGSGPRPILKATDFLYWWPNGPPELSCDHLAFIGLDFEGPHASSAFLFSGRQNDILWEDLRFRNVRIGIQVQHPKEHPKAPGVEQPKPTGMTIRRCAFVDCFGLCGLNMTHCIDTIIEENFFDHCGHPDPTIKKHNVYLQSLKGLKVRGNYFLRGSNMGLKCSTDKVEGFTDFEIVNNYFYNCALSLDHSAGITHDPATAHSHARGLVYGNVFHESARIFGTQRQDLAMWILNSREITYEYNHFVHKSVWNGNPMISWGEKQDRITFRNNLVYDWKYPSGKPDSHYFIGNWPQNVTNGIHEKNTIAKDGRVFLDPERSVLTHLSQPDIQAVSDALWLRTKENWNSSMTAANAVSYVIAGFEVVNPSPDPEPEPDPTPTPDKTIEQRLKAIEDNTVEILRIIKGK